MRRNLKALGVALAAVFAMSAMAATAAQAQTPKLTASNTAVVGHPHEHAILLATQDPTRPDRLRFAEEAIRTECDVSEATGTLDGEATTVTVKPFYDDCMTLDNFKTHVTTDGCFYLLHSGPQVGPDTYTTTAEIECEDDKEITLTITNLLQTKSICTIHIPEQVVGGHGLVENMTNANPTDVTITGDFDSIDYDATPISGGGCAGVEGTREDAEYTGTTTVRAINGAGEQIDLEANTLLPTP